MKPTNSLCTLLFVLAIMAAPDAYSLACPGTVTTAMGSQATMYGTGTATVGFVNSAPTCTGMLMGAATGCFQSASPGMATFAAGWPSITARTNDPVGGCGFTCPGGNCFVRNDGLPVELLEFEIGEDEEVDEEEKDSEK